MGKRRETGWKNPEKGPRCPGCGYPVFGLKKMICPECGRQLDVRDFSFDETDLGYRAKLTRDSLIGTLIGGVIVFIIFVGVLALTGVFAVRAHVIPISCIGLVLFFGIIAFCVLRTAGQDAREWRKFRKKRKD